MRGRDDVVEVALDEGDGPPLRPVSAAARRRSGREAAGLRAVATVIALGAAVAVGVQGAGLAAREERTFGATGLVDDLSAPLHEVWRGDPGEYLGSVGDLLVLADPGPGGVRAVDAGDGRVVWRLDDLPQRVACSIADLCAVNPPWSPAPVEPGADARVVWASERPMTGTATAATVQQAVVLDARTGTAVRRLTRVSDGAGGVMFAAGHVLVLAGARDGAPHAEGWSLVTGEQLWTWTGERRGVTIWTHAADRLWLVAAPPVALDATTGAQVSADDEITLAETALTGGRTARTVLRVRGDPELVLTDLSGVELPRVSGYHVPPAVRDAGRDPVLPVVLVGGGVAGIDIRTGARVWETAERFSPVAEVSGVLVSLEPSGMVALDVRSGRPLWVAAPGAEVASVVTDGQRIAYVDPAGPSLVVVDARDGHEVRRQTLGMPGSSTLTPLPDGRILQSGAGGVALLAP